LLCHFSAFGRALPAGGAAAFALFVIELAAFGYARVARVSAKRTKLRVELRIATDERGRHPANVRAIKAEPRASFSGP
jgi:hypothetical protein